MRNKAVLKEGVHLWRQQMSSLLHKRLKIFHRRYVLALIALLLPVVFQLVICLAIPSSSVLDKDLTEVRILGKTDLNINKYGPVQLLYNNLNSSNQTDRLLVDFYKHRASRLNIIKIDEDLGDYVSEEVSRDFTALYRQNFFGMSFELSETFDLNSSSITGYYSTMAYQSLGVIVNEMSNFLLFLLSGNQSRTISTFNSPLSSNSSKYFGDDFAKYLGCFDILPLSLFNFLTSITVAFIISFSLIHVAKETINRSKHLQLLSGSHQLTYWLSNYLFDMILCGYNVTLLVVVVWTAGGWRQDNSDVVVLAAWPAIGYVMLVLAVSSLSWPLYGYCWCHCFKSDVTAFIVLWLLLCMAAFVDVLCAFVQIFTHINNLGLGFDAALPSLMYAVRMLLSLLFPNVTVKRQLFDLRLRTSNYCVDVLNDVIKSNLI